MKNFLKLVSLFIVLTISTGSVWAINLNKAHYQGIAKMKGQTVDFWVNVDFDDEDAEIDFGEKLNVMGAYTKTESGKNITLNIKVPAAPNAIFKSTDGGSTFQGKIKVGGIDYDVWVLKVPAKLKKAEQSDDELKTILSSPDGYTSFCIFNTGEGICSVTCDFEFSPDGQFNLICDSAGMQDIFRNFKGTYSISDGTVTLNSVAGVSFSGTIYDNGNYLKIPVGKKDGISLTLVLIR